MGHEQGRSIQELRTTVSELQVQTGRLETSNRDLSKVSEKLRSQVSGLENKIMEQTQMKLSVDEHCTRLDHDLVQSIADGRVKEA